MTTRVFTDRSRIITAQRCLRRRYYEYHCDGMGIRSASTPLALSVGGSVHEGLATLLRMSSSPHVDVNADYVEDMAVAVALADFAQYTPALELDAGEQAAFAPPTAGEDPAFADMAEGGRGKFDG